MGYLWFATGNGLSRYDGYSFQNFWKPQLPSNLVIALAQDKEEALWIGTSEGLTRYCQRKGTFTPFALNLQGKERGSSVLPNIQALYLDSQSRLWFGPNPHRLLFIPTQASLNLYKHST